MTRTGSCLCGQAGYTAQGDPAISGSCYCADCRRETGSGHLTIVGYPEAAVCFSGETASFSKTSDAGSTVTRHFCPQCGSTLYARSELMPGLVTLRAGSLDDPSGIEIQMAVYCARAQAWDPVPAGVHGFDIMPPPEMMPK